MYNKRKFQPQIYVDQSRHARVKTKAEGNSGKALTNASPAFRVVMQFAFDLQSHMHIFHLFGREYLRRFTAQLANSRNVKGCTVTRIRDK